jgi:tellurite resistance protein TehA-like permease
LFAATVILSFVINWQTARLCRRQGFQFLHALSVGMNAAGMGMVVGSMFLTAFFLPNYWIHFALTVSISVAARKKAQTLPPAPAPAVAAVAALAVRQS